MSTAEQRDLAARAVFAKVFADDVKAVVGQLREVLEPQLAPDEGVAAVLPDGTRIGTVKRSKVRQVPAVTDETALLAWVREHRPDELVESVNPAFVEHLKACARKRVLAVLDDGTVVPGVELVDGNPSYLPQPDPAAVPVLRAKLAELVAGGLLALPSSSDNTDTENPDA